MLLLETGMRSHREALSLRWDAIDFGNKIIEVRESKTRSGIRNVPLTSRCSTELLRWRGNCESGIFAVRFPKLSKTPATKTGYPIRSYQEIRLNTPKALAKPEKERLRSVGYVNAYKFQGVCPDAQVFYVIVDYFLKLTGYGSGFIGVCAGEKPIAQAGNAICHVHRDRRMPNDGKQAAIQLSTLRGYLRPPEPPPVRNGYWRPRGLVVVSYPPSKYSSGFSGC